MSADDDRISRLYREAGKPGPSQALDDAVLSASRKAVAKTAHSGPFSGAWPAFASVAAVVLITLILVPVLKQEQPMQKTESLTAENYDRALPAFDEQTDHTSAAESGRKSPEKSMAASPPAVLLEQDRAEERRAVPAAELADMPTIRTSTAGKAPVSAAMEQPADTGVATDIRSRMATAGSAPFAIITPEMWEIRISQLIDEGKTALAKAELDKLKQRFPMHEIDRAILEQLETDHE